MKCLATVLAILGLMAITTSANAISIANPIPMDARQHLGGAHHYRKSPLGDWHPSTVAATAHDSAYWLAVRQGGPCGLTAEREIFGRSDHVLNGWNPWLAHNWKGFPETPPAIGMVAVWRNDSHVEVIHNLNGNGTFNRGWNLALVIVVNPHGEHRNVEYAYRPRHARHRRYAGI